MSRLRRRAVFASSAPQRSLISRILGWAVIFLPILALVFVVFIGFLDIVPADRTVSHSVNIQNFSQDSSLDSPLNSPSGAEE